MTMEIEIDTKNMRISHTISATETEIILLNPRKFECENVTEEVGEKLSTAM